MENETAQQLTTAIISKQAVLHGLKERAEQLAKQLETALRQIDEINQEITVIYELQNESSNDPDTRDPSQSTTLNTPIDTEPVNHQEEQ